MKTLINIVVVAATGIMRTILGCSDEEIIAPVKDREHKPVIRDYMLALNDAEKEVRTKDTGDFIVPWAEGMSARRFDSTVVSIQDGFMLPAQPKAGEKKGRSPRISVPAHDLDSLVTSSIAAWLSNASELFTDLSMKN